MAYLSNSIAAIGGDTDITRAMLHTASGLGGVAVIVVNGARAAEIISRFFTPMNPERNLPDCGEILLGTLRDYPNPDPAGNELFISHASTAASGRLDEVLLARTSRLVDQGGEQVLCDDVFEINIHGGRQVVRSVLQLLADAGVAIDSGDGDSSGPDIWQHSFPGLNNPAIGREMIVHLQAAECRMAVELLSGQWSSGLSAMAAELVKKLEGKEPSAASANSISQLRTAAEGYSTAQKLLDPPTVVFAGPPNAGKTSLVNAIAARTVGIVSDIPGTTRDWLSQHVEISGIALNLIDTAGLWEGGDELDAESVARSWSRIKDADLVVVVIDAAEATAESDDHIASLLALDNTLIVANKCDLLDDSRIITGEYSVSISAATGSGLSLLCELILEKLLLAHLDTSQPVAFTARQCQLLLGAADSLSSSDLCLALNQLRELLGRSALGTTKA